MRSASGAGGGEPAISWQDGPASAATHRADGLFFEAAEAAVESVQVREDQRSAERKRELASSGRQIRVHVSSEHGVDSRLIALLFSQPFK